MADRESYLAAFVRILSIVGSIDLGIFLVVGLIGWFLLGWRTLEEYGLGLVVGGVAALVIGMCSLLGAGQLRDQSASQYGRVFRYQDPRERLQLELKETRASYSFFWLMAVSAILPIISGMLIQSFLKQ